MQSMDKVQLVLNLTSIATSHNMGWGAANYEVDLTVRYWTGVPDLCMELAEDTVLSTGVQDAGSVWLSTVGCETRGKRLGGPAWPRM